MDTPILIVANDFDPNTPLVDARGLAHALGMEDSLLRYEGGGHTAFFKGIACIDAAIDAYLIDRQLPPPGSSCPAQPVRFGSAARTLSGARATAVQVDTGLWSGALSGFPLWVAVEERHGAVNAVDTHHAVSVAACHERRGGPWVTIERHAS